MDKVFENVQTKEPNTIQYQIVKNSKKPNEVIVFEEVRLPSSWFLATPS